MIPRKRLDLGWSDLASALAHALAGCALQGLAPRALEARRQRLLHRVERAWPPAEGSVAVLSVRSGFDLLLQALCLPPGSEILCSAVTIADMPRIARAHGLRVVPVALDMERLEVTPDALEAAWSPAARLVLVAHLFGARMPLEKVSAWCRERDLLLVEDVAQGWRGAGDRGDPLAHVSLFSFGPIKTRTALGGGILRAHPPGLASRIRKLRDAARPHREGWFLARALRMALVQALLLPPLYGALVRLLRWGGNSADATLNGAVRGFPGGDLLAAIRHAPPAALLALLLRRLRAPGDGGANARREVAARTLSHLPTLPRPGTGVRAHGHWILPVLVEDPVSVARALRRRGVDATVGASSLEAVRPEEVASPPGHVSEDRGREGWAAAHAVMRHVLYLPHWPGMPPLPEGPLRDLEASVARPRGLPFTQEVP